MIGRSKTRERRRTLKDHEGSGLRRFLRYLLLFLSWGRHILREAFQGNFARAGRRFLRFVGCALDESSFQHIICFIAPTFAIASLDRPLKFERYAMDGIGSECELV